MRPLLLLLFLGTAAGCAAARTTTPVTLAARLSGFVWPLPVETAASVTSRFGPRRERHHDGLDISARRGDPVYAASGGSVAFSGSRGAYGEMVVLDHGDGVRTVYAHLSQRWVAEGERVRKAQPIGAVGATGNATGPHLHFEVTWAGYPIDPRPLLPRLATRCPRAGGAC